MLVQAIHMWDTDSGLTALNPYTYSSDPDVVAGSCLGIGLCCTCIRSEIDPACALALLSVSARECTIFAFCALFRCGIVTEDV